VICSYQNSLSWSWKAFESGSYSFLKQLFFEEKIKNGVLFTIIWADRSNFLKYRGIEVFHDNAACESVLSCKLICFFQNRFCIHTHNSSKRFQSEDGFSKLCLIRHQ